MGSPHVAALEMRVEPENWSGRLEVRSLIDGDVANTNVSAFAGLASRHLDLPTKGASDLEATAWLVAETRQSNVRVAQATRTRTYGRDTEPVTAALDVIDAPSTIGHQLSVEVAAGESITIEKVVAVFTSHDYAISEPLIAARDQLGQTGRFDDLLSAHALAWEQLWRRFRIGVHGVEHGLRSVNINTFHVLQTLSPYTADLDVGVPARGLHGEGYRGHVFWDEVFVFPILNFRLPELTRALLQYRHRRLATARRHAAQVASGGALFPWQSGSDGREETPTHFFNPRSGRWIPDNSRREYHVNLAVAYNVWHYWEVTGDLSFLANYGAELLIEIARFWAGLATYDATDDRYDLRGVMGPDEFHDGYPDRPGQGIDNNAYVNVMTAWTLSRARDAHDVLGHHHSGDLWERLGLSTGELDNWDHISRRLRVPFLASGLIAQFEGYEELTEFDWLTYRDRYDDIGRLDLILEAEGDSPNRYKVSKQADALVLFYLLSAEELTTLFDRLSYPFDTTTIPATIDYYLARTSHGSTLSRIAHAWVLARANRHQSWTLLRDALGSDLFDTQGGTTSEGVHLGAMAGSVDILQRCYTGLEVRGGVLRFNPRLPAELGALEFDLLYHGQWITVHVDHANITLRTLPCTALPVKVSIGQTMHELAPDETLCVPLQ
jgi:trehalose/maltose hydrolase-like predicted phosphorylase